MYVSVVTVSYLCSKASHESCASIERVVSRCIRRAAHGYLAHKEQRPPRTLQEDYAQHPTVVLGGGAVSYERGTPVPAGAKTQEIRSSITAVEPRFTQPAIQALAPR